jgi:four helix bundle protein
LIENLYGTSGRCAQEAHKGVRFASYPGHSFSAAGHGGKDDRSSTPAFGNVSGSQLQGCVQGSEFLAKIAIVIEEADESEFWLEMLADAGLIPERKLKDLRSEANQLVAIFNASRTTAKKGVQSAINNQQSTIPRKRAS